jgi:hypothetical protein
MNLDFFGASPEYHRNNVAKILSSLRANRYHFLTPLQNMLISTFSIPSRKWFRRRSAEKCSDYNANAPNLCDENPGYPAIMT